MSTNTSPGNIKHHRSTRIILQVATAIYLYLILENLINGLFARLGFQPNYSYRPETPADALYFFFGLIISLLPIVGLVFTFLKYQVSIRKRLSQEPVFISAIVPFVWLFFTSTIRSLLALVLWFSPSPLPFIETLIFVVQLSILAIIIICFIFAYFQLKPRRTLPPQV